MTESFVPVDFEFINLWFKASVIVFIKQFDPIISLSAGNQHPSISIDDTPSRSSSSQTHTTIQQVKMYRSAKKQHQSYFPRPHKKGKIHEHHSHCLAKNKPKIIIKILPTLLILQQIFPHSLHRVVHSELLNSSVTSAQQLRTINGEGKKKK
jgi:hypothetical protein